MKRVTPRYPSRTKASPGLTPCNRLLPVTAHWRTWEIPWPSPHVRPARLALPEDYHLVGEYPGSDGDEEDAETFRLATNRALGIWFATRPGRAREARADVRSWALHISPHEEYGNASFVPPPAVLEEYECSLASEDGRVWNVMTYITESKEFGTLYNLTAYSAIPGGLYLRAGGSGSAPDAEAEALAILASYHQGQE